MTRSAATTGETEAKVEVLVERYGLGLGARGQLLAALATLSSDPHAPTTVREPAAAADDHLADSLVALELPLTRAARSIADLGAGAGFPGAALAIALPDVSVALVESNARKCAFIERLAGAAELSRVTVVNARAEAWGAGLGACDLVTARAVAPLTVLAEYAAPLLRIGGSLVAWRGRRDAAAERAALAAAGQLGLEVAEPVRVEPYPGAEHRHLHVMRKVAPTPAGFPRRPGVAAKRPLATARQPI